MQEGHPNQTPLWTRPFPQHTPGTLPLPQRKSQRITLTQTKQQSAWRRETMEFLMPRCRQQHLLCPKCPALVSLIRYPSQTSLPDIRLLPYAPPHSSFLALFSYHVLLPAHCPPCISRNTKCTRGGENIKELCPSLPTVRERRMPGTPKWTYGYIFSFSITT